MLSPTDSSVVSVLATCDGEVPQLGLGLGSGLPRRAAAALRRLLGGLGMHLKKRCELVGGDKSVEGAHGKQGRYSASERTRQGLVY